VGLELWFQEDVARILASTHETMRATTSALQDAETGALDGQELADAYQRGFADALRAVAIAFGVRPPGPGIVPEPSARMPELRFHALPASREWSQTSGYGDDLIPGGSGMGSGRADG
jgi:hypothetical protein